MNQQALTIPAEVQNPERTHYLQEEAVHYDWAQEAHANLVVVQVTPLVKVDCHWGLLLSVKTVNTHTHTHTSYLKEKKG